MSEPDISAQKELKRGFRWWGSMTVVARIIEVSSMFVVLSIITKAENGLATAAMTVITILEAISGFGVPSAIVQTPELSERETHSLFWFTTGFGAFLAAALALSSPLLGHFLLKDERLVPMLAFIAIKLFFLGVAIVPLQLFARGLKFRHSAGAQTAAAAFDSITKVVLALSGAGAWSIVGASAMRGVFLVIVVFAISSYRPRFQFARSDLRRFLIFGRSAAGYSLLQYTYRNLDNLLVGRFLGAEALGIYGAAYQIALSPQEVIVTMVNRAAYPVYARIQSNTTLLVETFFKTTKYLLLILGPVTAAIFVVGRYVIPLIGHGKWNAAIPLVSLLTAAALVRGLASAFPALFTAVGKPRLAVIESLIAATTLFSGFFLALGPLHAGTLGVAWAWLLTFPFMLVFEFWFARKCAPMSVAGYFRAILPELLGIALTTIAMLLVDAVSGLPRGPILTPVLLLTVGGVVFVAYLHFALGVFRTKPGGPAAGAA